MFPRVWRLAAVAAAALLALVPLPPNPVERFYARGLYPAMQPVVTGATNLSAFAALDVLVAGAVVWVGWRLVRRWRASRGRVRAAAAFVWDLAAGAASVYLAFLVLWGLHYQRQPPGERFAVESDRITAARLERLGGLAVARVNALYDRERDGDRLELQALAPELRPPFLRALDVLGTGWEPAPGRPKLSLVAQMFPLAGVDGLMNPLGLEVLVNPEALPFERPFLLAHEWAHLAGQARESEASFVAWLACLEGTRDMQYSAWLSTLIHVRRSLPPAAGARLPALDEGPRADLDAIRRRLARAEPMVTRATWRVYDGYLRANRVEAGLANYDEVVRLILGSTLAAAHVDAASRPAPTPPR